MVALSLIPTRAGERVKTGVEIFESGHRRRPVAVKAQALAETLEPGAKVNGAAARYGVKPN